MLGGGHAPKLRHAPMLNCAALAPQTGWALHGLPASTWPKPRCGKGSTAQRAPVSALSYIRSFFLRLSLGLHVLRHALPPTDRSGEALSERLQSTPPGKANINACSCPG
jgi:hypothetical protein